MHQCSGLQCMSRSFAPQITPGQTTQFGTNQRRQRFESRLSGVCPFLETPRNVVRRGHGAEYTTPLLYAVIPDTFRRMIVFRSGLRMKGERRLNSNETKTSYAKQDTGFR